MSRVKTFTNGGSLLPGDLNSIEDDYEFAFSTYRSASPGAWALGLFVGTAAGTYIIGPETTPVAGAGRTDLVNPQYLDPADYTAGGRTTKYRLRAWVQTNAVAPGCSFTVGLYPVATWGGVSGGTPNVATLGAVTAGSTVLFTTPALSSQIVSTSGDFTAPAAGWFVFGVSQTGGSVAANAELDIKAALQVRQV